MKKFALIFTLVSLGIRLPVLAGQAGPRVHIFETQLTSVALIPLIPKTPRRFQDSSPPTGENDQRPAVFSLNPHKTFQAMDGFGATLTESCAMNLMRLPAEERREVMHKVFSKRDGAGFDLLRLPLGATDFSDSTKPNYSYDDSPTNEPDHEFRFYDMSRDEKSFALIREARAINPNLQVLISPWSAPAWMKTSKDLRGGTLDFQYAPDFAHYFLRTIHELWRRGVPVKSLTIQNEPGYANEWYPSMGMEAAEQATFIRDHLGPLLRSKNIPVRIFAHDHNWDMSQDYVVPILNDMAARSYIGGVAYHCYGGYRWQMGDSMNLYPEIPTLQTECSGSFNPNPIGDFHWWLQNQSVDAVNIGTTGALGWNLCLDETGGPRNNGCEGCRGLVTTDFSKPKAEVTYNPEFHALAQVSRFIRPGSHRIEVVASQAPESLITTAFLNEDGSLVFVAENAAEKNQSLRLQTPGGFSLDYEVPAWGAVTFIWSSAE